ncbi:uncharacterized protein LOC129766726 [Toxorhynchites rutilus septentrionalis]|uniref:uncharacterized protein LOC129766726 n=1 Tax=Toxorhynchites rutilus septentrionalis TaxID=329112 RepID=UPI0024785D8B|nr:uncharacterized protein LOC129766726 [Toxorhynchites rutilus septentrionalis]
MFKLVLLSAAFVMAAAAPHASVIRQPALVAHKEISYRKSIIEEPTVAHVGTVVKHVPTGVTHHSSSVVHDKKFSDPIYAHGSKKTIVATPVEKTTYHHTVAAAPVLTYAAAPIAKAAYVEAAPAWTYTAPAIKTAYVGASSALSYSAVHHGTHPVVYGEHY